jgi:hypothetical protein
MKTIHTLVQKINTCLEKYSDMGWNYSRIRLQLIPIQQLNSPYALAVETSLLTTPQGQAELKALRKEIEWGDRHSNELGILEIISLRVNKALLQSVTEPVWQGQFPIVRLVKLDDLRSRGAQAAVWYEVTEVNGENFDSR